MTQSDRDWAVIGLTRGCQPCRYESCSGTRSAQIRELLRYENCPGTRSAQIRELLRYESCSGTRAAKVRELSRYEKCPDTRSAQVRELLRYENCPGMKSAQIRELLMYESGRKCGRKWPKVAESVVLAGYYWLLHGRSENDCILSDAAPASADFDRPTLP